MSSYNQRSSRFYKLLQTPFDSFSSLNDNDDDAEDEVIRNIIATSKRYAESLAVPSCSSKQPTLIRPHSGDLERVLVLRENVSSDTDDHCGSDRVLGPLRTTIHDNLTINGQRYSSVQSFVDDRLTAFDNRVNLLIECRNLIMKDGQQQSQQQLTCQKIEDTTTRNIDDFRVTSRVINDIKGGSSKKKRRKRRKNNIGGEEEDDELPLEVDSLFIETKKNELRAKSYYDSFVAKIKNHNEYERVSKALLCDTTSFQRVVHVRQPHSCYNDTNVLNRRVPCIDILSSDTMLKTSIHQNALGIALTKLRNDIINSKHFSDKEIPSSTKTSSSLDEKEDEPSTLIPLSSAVDTTTTGILGRTVNSFIEELTTDINIGRELDFEDLQPPPQQQPVSSQGAKRKPLFRIPKTPTNKKKREKQYAPKTSTATTKTDIQRTNDSQPQKEQSVFDKLSSWFG